jgi:hypothetical protein
VAGQSLKSPAEFESISDKAARSRAMFTEIAKVLTHPRCMNCHPAGANPQQGSDRHEHMPPVWREDVASSASGTNCSACHHDENFAVSEATTYKSIPGHARWGLAPLSMAWQGKSIGDICRQVKDVKLNGGRDLALLQEHIAKDDLVAWGWNPGAVLARLSRVVRALRIGQHGTVSRHCILRAVNPNTEKAALRIEDDTF